MFPFDRQSCQQFLFSLRREVSHHHFKTISLYIQLIETNVMYPESHSRFRNILREYHTVDAE